MRRFNFALMALVCAVAFADQTSLTDKAWTVLDEGLKDKSFEKRTQAVAALGILVNNSRARTLAEGLLKDPNSDVRTAAAHSLGDMKAKLSVTPLKAALDDQDPGVVLAAAGALNALGDPTAYDVYYEVLTGERKTSSGIRGQMKVLHDPKKMALMGVDEGIGFVPFAGIPWGAYKFLSKDDVSPVRASAAAVLSKDKDPKSGEALAKAITDKKWLVQVAAVRALALRDDRQYLDAVATAMADDGDKERIIVRYNAAAAVIRLSAVRTPASRPKKK